MAGATRGWEQMKKPDCASLSLCRRTFKLNRNKKSIVPEQRSRKCFSCLEIPMFYLYGHSMYLSHIAISWLWYIWKNSCIDKSLKYIFHKNTQIDAQTFKIRHSLTYTHTHKHTHTNPLPVRDVTRGVVVIVVGNEHGDTSSNPGRD